MQKKNNSNSSNISNEQTNNSTKWGISYKLIKRCLHSVVTESALHRKIFLDATQMHNFKIQSSPTVALGVKIKCAKIFVKNVTSKIYSSALYKTFMTSQPV